jgi:uncharacterized protein (TIGR04562 family)
MDFSFDPDVLQSVAGGRSALEMRRLHILNLEAASSFLKSYGFDSQNETDVKKLWYHHRRALVLLTEKLGFSETEIPAEIRDPKVLQDLRLLLLYASREGRDELQKWSCALLRAMHVFVHAESDLFSFFSEEIQKQILSPFERAIHHVGQKISLKGQIHTENQIDLSHFQIKPFKTSSSTVIKLLAKPDAIAMRIFDKIGVRFVTHSVFDSFQVIRFLVRENMISFPHIMPDQSSNNLYPVDLFLRVCEELEKKGLRRDSEVETYLSHQITQDEQKNLFRKNNEQSATDFKFIKFISRKLIRIQPQGAQEEFSFFYPFEVQIMDQKAFEMTQTGPVEHQAYKERQRQAARARLFPEESTNPSLSGGGEPERKA